MEYINGVVRKNNKTCWDFHSCIVPYAHQLEVYLYMQRGGNFVMESRKLSLILRKLVVEAANSHSIELSQFSQVTIGQ